MALDFEDASLAEHCEASLANYNDEDFLEKLDCSAEHIVNNEYTTSLVEDCGKICGECGDTYNEERKAVSKWHGKGKICEIKENFLGWDFKFSLSSVAKEELKFWVNNLRKLNGRCIINDRTFQAVCFSDASATGFGGYEVSNATNPVHGEWQPFERRKSSTWRELVALLRTLQALSGILGNKTIKWFVDNAGVVSILRFGSRKKELHQIAKTVWQLCRFINSNIFPQWIPRERNQLADQWSRYSDKDEWGLIDEQFGYIDGLWGPHTVDRFATRFNARCARFNSKMFCLQAEGIDTFAQNWNQENNWFCPPVNLIVKVLEKCKQDKAEGTLIVPFWPSAYFFPLIKPDGMHFANFVVAFEIFYGSYKSSRATSNSIFDKFPNFDTLALRIRF